MSSEAPSTPNFQPIFNEALKEYKRKTGKDLTAHSLAAEINGCGSPDAILAVLEGKANELDQSQSSDERLTKWLTPTVNVLSALSATLGEGVGTVFPPTKIIFSGISILLVAARDTAASRDALIELFDKIKKKFVRLKTYTEVPPTVEMTNVMSKIMAEMLCMLAIATKEMKQKRTKTFFKKLVGRNDIEGALQRLDKLEQGELRTVTAQVLKATSDLKNVASGLQDATTILKHDAKETKVMVQRIVSDLSSHGLELLLQELRGWLTPPDPSTNHNIACSTQHSRTAAWVFNEDIFKEWESSGSLLWIHGKAGSGKSILCSAIIQHVITLCDAGSAFMAYFYFDFRDVDKKHRCNLLRSLLMQLSSQSEGCLNILSRLYSTYKVSKGQPSEHSLVQCLKDMLMAPSHSQLPIYIILDAVDECPNTSGIPTPRGLVLGLVEDLVDLCLPNLHICATSRPEIDIRTTLGPLTTTHFSLHDQPGQKRDIAEYVSAVVQSDIQMRRWREDDRNLVMEKLSEKADGMFRWVFCQLEMLRHCLAPSLRRQLNELPTSLDETYERVLKEIESTNQGRHSRRLLHCLAVSIRPLHVQELAEVLAFDLDAAEGEIPKFHPEWRWEDQEQAVLSACSSLISVVDSSGSRVVQFAHFSVKEYLMSNRLSARSRDISRYHILPEPAHLILAHACLGVLLNSDNLKNKESEEGSGKYGGKTRNRDEDIPLLMYAAEHWVSHAEVGNVASFLNDAMETLFDLKRPYFLAWIRKHDIDRQSPWPARDLNPLYCAALCGFHDLVRHLIVKHPEQLNQRDGRLKYPLVAALSGKHFRVATLLLEHGARVNVRGHAPLCHVIQFSDEEPVDAVQFLLVRGADVNATEENLRTPLLLATFMGYLKVARLLLEDGAELDARDVDGQAPLHLVSNRTAPERQSEDEDERSNFARILVERGSDVKVQDRNNATPLHCASYYGRPQIAQLLLDHGADARAKNIHGRNSLHELSLGLYRYKSHPFRTSLTPGVEVYPSRKALNIALLLLERGVDVNALDENHATPLHLASSHGMLEIVRLLLDRGATANTVNVHGQTPLHLVSQDEYFAYEHPDITRLLLETGLEVNAQDKFLQTPLHFACSHGNLEIARALLDHGASVNTQNTYGRTPLHLAPQFSDYHKDHDSPVAQLLLERGADVDARDKDQATPLHFACSLGSFEAALTLLDHRADVNAQNADDQTPLHRASQLSKQVPDYEDDPSISISRLLLDRGAKVDALDKYHATPLHLASYESKFETVQMLLDRGAEADVKNVDGQTPLHRASQSSGHREGDDSRAVVQLLLERGVDVNARDKAQETPLHLASYNWDLKTVQVLLDYGAEADFRNADGQTPLHRVSQSSQDYKYDGPDVARLLLERGVDVHTRDKDQATPLHLASYYGNSKVGEALLDHGARARAEDAGGQTPLHQVLLGNQNYKSFSMNLCTLKRDPGKAVCFARRLLERGADVNARNKDHNTPLHLASRLRLHEMARLLLKHGAGVDMKNSEGKSPLQLSSGRKGKAMKRLLSEYSTKQI